MNSQSSSGKKASLKRRTQVRILPTMSSLYKNILSSYTGTTLNSTYSAEQLGSARKSRATVDSSTTECFYMVLCWPWCNGSTRLCESRSMGSLPIGQPRLKIVYKAQSQIHVGKITQLSFGCEHIIHDDAANTSITQAQMEIQALWCQILIASHTSIYWSCGVDGCAPPS